MAESRQWTFFTNHGHVLFCLARDPGQPLREVARTVGITERAVQRIVAELESEGFLEREKVGRRNRYTIRSGRGLRHPLESHRTIGDLLEFVLDDSDPGSASKRGFDHWRVGEHGSEIH